MKPMNSGAVAVGVFKWMLWVCLSLSSTVGLSQTLSAGSHHSLAIKEDGTVVAWGYNLDGQCDVPRNLKAVAVSAGIGHSLAIKEDGTVVVWGSNLDGQCDV